MIIFVLRSGKSQYRFKKISFLKKDKNMLLQENTVVLTQMIVPIIMMIQLKNKVIYFYLYSNSSNNDFINNDTIKK